MSYKDEVLENITVIFRRELGEADLEITYSSSPSTIEKWDSVSNLVLINAIEEAYQLSFPIDEIFRMEKVGDICDYIVKTRNQE
jgi:acyl carrier protein